MQVVKCLLTKGQCEVIVVSGAAIGLFFQSQLTEQEKKKFDFRTRVFDSGALQPHAFTVDMNASLDEYMRLGETAREEQLLARIRPLRERKFKLCYTRATQIRRVESNEEIRLNLHE